MKIIGISYPDTIDNEVALAQEMLDCGMYKFHVRKPNWTPKKLIPYIKSFDKKYRQKIILHDLKHWPFNELFGGVHLKGRNTDFSIRKEVKSLSRSCHSLKEIEKFRGELDYMFLSPVFDSISKRDYHAAFDADELSVANLKKVFALGGVDTKNLKQVRDFGFIGAAVLGALWHSKNPVKSMSQLLEVAHG